MNISSFQIQNVIKAYGQRVERRGLAKLKRTSAPAPTPDKISISSEAKKRQVLSQVVDGIIEKAKVSTSKEIDRDALMAKLGEQLGGKLEMMAGGDRSSTIRFKKIDGKNGETVRELSPEEDLKGLIDSLYAKLDLTEKDS